MTEESKRNLGISISSTDVPTIEMCEDTLKLSFLNWDYQAVQLDFASALSFRWNNLPYPDELEDDVALEVFNSEWLREALFGSESKRDDDTHYHHYQFCVSGCWLFEVIAEGVGVTMSEPEVVPVSWAKCAI